MFRRYPSLLAIILSISPLSADVIISEFMANNSATLADQDGEYSDWIEIANTGAISVDLTGWYLTDDEDFNSTDAETFWQFPTRTLAINESIIVFASEKDLSPVNTGELHTNFKLSSGGEYLALIQPDGTTIATEFAPEYPTQQVDISYGLGNAAGSNTNYISEGSDLKVRIPTNNSDGTDWTGSNANFDDSSWADAQSGIGFDAGAGASGFTLIDSFDDLNPAAIDGQNGWSSTSNTITVANDPENVENQVLKLEGDSVQAYKAIDFPNGETNTLFFRVRRDGLMNFGAGTADTGAPNNWNSYETILNTQSDGIMKIRDEGDYLDVGNFNDEEWYFIWMVIDNATDTYEVYAQGGQYTEQTLLESGNTTVFTFRNGSASNALETFYTRTANNSQGNMLLDDIYLGEGENLGIPIGGTGYSSLINENGNIEAGMLDINSSAYLRIPFTTEGISENTDLTLKMRYDDGFIAYLNGTEIARRNASSTEWNATSSTERISSEAIQFEEIDVSDFVDQLIPNESNILAIHGQNTSVTDPDFLQTAELYSETFNSLIEAVYFKEATPGGTNATGFLGLINDTDFSQNRGFYDAPFDVIISTETSGTTIIYTTDGSTPSEINGIQAASPATINITTTTALRAMAVREGYLPTNVDTQTYIFIADVITQNNTPDGYPTEWLGSGGDGTLPADYEMDAEVTTDPAYADRIAPALLAIPTISIVTDQEHFFDTSTGIYQRPQQSGSDWERPVSIEIIQPDEALDNIQVDAGIRIQGGHTRNPNNNPKHSFRLLFKSEYGASKLEYDLFPEDPDAAEEFDQLILRAGGNQSWLHHNTFLGTNRERAQYVRDQWAKDVQLSMGHPGLRNNAAHLYINGIYWGLYNPTERATSGYGESYLGGDKEDYVSLNSGEEVSGDEAALTEFQALENLASSDLTDASNYAQMAELLDLEAFADYMIVQQYGGNVDWPHHNWYAIRNTNGGKWYFIMWDSEFIFVEDGANVIDQNIHNREGPPLDILDSLMLNEDFSILFADRIQKYLVNEGGLLTPDQVLISWEKRSDHIFEPLVAESARWGDYRRDVHSRGGPTPIPLYDPDNEWMDERNRLLNTYFPNRTETVIEQYKDVGYFPELSAALLSNSGGTVPQGFELDITTPDGGSVYYTTDGSDPRTETTSAISANAMLYSSTISIENSLTIRARVLSGLTWSPIVEATFTLELPAAFEDLVISEVMYNQDGSDDAEFIELLNIGSDTLDLTGVHFSEGIEFEFPMDTKLAPNSYLLVVRDETAFVETYGSNHPIAGSFSNDTALDNGGEAITLVTSENSIIRSFIYDDVAPWPTEADGTGSSLQLIDPDSNPDHALAINWEASSEIGGTPATIFDGSPEDDEDSDGASALLEFAQGTSDSDSADRGDAFFIYTDGENYYLAYLVNIASNLNLSVIKSTNLTIWEPADSSLELATTEPTDTDNQQLETYLITDSDIENLYFRLNVK